MQTDVPFNSLLSLLLFDFLLDRAFISIEFVFFSEFNATFEFLSVFFEAVLNDRKQVWVYIVRRLFDES